MDWTYSLVTRILFGNHAIQYAIVSPMTQLLLVFVLTYVPTSNQGFLKVSDSKYCYVLGRFQDMATHSLFYALMSLSNLISSGIIYCIAENIRPMWACLSVGYKISLVFNVLYHSTNIIIIEINTPIKSFFGIKGQINHASRHSKLFTLDANVHTLVQL